MNKKQYNSKVNDLYKHYDLDVDTSITNKAKIETINGMCVISSEYLKDIKLVNIHSRLILDGINNMSKKDSVNAYIKINEIGFDFNVMTGKCSFYFDNPEDCLDQLNEYINNLLYFLTDSNKDELTTKYKEYITKNL